MPLKTPQSQLLWTSWAFFKLVFCCFKLPHSERFCIRLEAQARLVSLPKRPKQLTVQNAERRNQENRKFERSQNYPIWRTIPLGKTQAAKGQTHTVQHCAQHVQQANYTTCPLLLLLGATSHATLQEIIEFYFSNIASNYTVYIPLLAILCTIPRCNKLKMVNQSPCWQCFTAQIKWLETRFV